MNDPYAGDVPLRAGVRASAPIRQAEATAYS